jgi:hypothetical protein
MLANEMAKGDTPGGIRGQIHLPSKKFIYLMMGFLVVYVIIRGVFAAATRSFWYDELTTIAICSQSSLKAIWGALAHAVDGQPPSFFWIERVAIKVFQNRQIAARLPAILAMPCTLICVFAYVKRSSGESIAFLCASLILSTILFSRYAVEARPYSMLMACISFALICYQRQPSSFWTVMLGISLVAAQSLHYYAAFAMVPFGLAEAVLLLRTRQLRWTVWVALACGPMPLLFFWPLLANLRTYYGTHYYTHYGFTSLPSTYGAFFLTDSGYGAAIATVAIAGVIGSRLLTQPGTSPASEIRNVDLAEGTLLVAFVALPLIACFVIKVTHGGMRDAYAMGAIIGICVAFGSVLSFARPAVLALFAVFLFSSVGVREFIFWRSSHSFHLGSPTAAVEEFVGKSGYPDLPLVVASGMKYTPYAYYASPTFYKRLYYLTDETKQYQYQGTDTLDKHVVILRDYMPLQVRDFSEFTAAHPEFLLYAEEPDDGGTWLPLYLSHEAASMRTVGMESSRRLYLVTMKGNMSH